MRRCPPRPQLQRKTTAVTVATDRTPGPTRFGPLRGENEQSHELHALREYENANQERTLTCAPEVGHGRVITSWKSQGVLCPNTDW
jgi:hypothetical protein